MRAKPAAVGVGVARVGRTLLSVAFDLAFDFALDFDFDPSRRDTHRRQYHRGRAALQRRVKPPKINSCHSERGRRPGEEPAVDFCLRPHKTLPREKSGRARPSSRANYASRKKRTGLQPLRPAMRGRPPSAVHSSEARKLRVGRTLLSVAFDPASDFAPDFDFDLSRRDVHRRQHNRGRAALTAA
jgi:hypothetical protein